MISFKISFLAAVVLLAIDCGRATPGFIGASQGGHENSDDGHVVDYHAYPKYQYNYAVNDPHTGDIKNHWEERDGGVVKGSYSLHEADGTIRIVEYTADKQNGFNAVVHRTGTAKHDYIGHNH